MATQGKQCNTLEDLLFDDIGDPLPIKLSVLQSITNDFSEEQIIGSGGFGIVYKVCLTNSWFYQLQEHFKTYHLANFEQEVHVTLPTEYINVQLEPYNWTSIPYFYTDWRVLQSHMIIHENTGWKISGKTEIDLEIITIVYDGLTWLVIDESSLVGQKVSRLRYGYRGGPVTHVRSSVTGHNCNPSQNDLCHLWHHR